MEIPLTVVILAAGLGTRMKSRKAKVLHRAGGKALVEHVVEKARALTLPERIFVVVGHQAEEVERTLAGTGVRFIEQADQKGTGHAVTSGRDVLAGLGGYLMVLYGDSPLLQTETLRRLVDMEVAGDAAASLLTARMADPTGYGRVIRNGQGQVRRIVEQKAATCEELEIREANMGIYCFRADLFWRHAGEMHPDNPAHEYYLTDMAEILNQAGHHVEPMEIADPGEALGINDRLELAAADRLLRERKLRELMAGGVTIEKPETVTVDADVQIGMDTLIEPFVQIRGRTSIGENCRIGSCAIVEDSRLGDEVEIGPFTIVVRSRLEREAHVGPFARLRFDNDVAEGAHVGNFVELKKTRLGPGAKAMHLAYLGDSTIGGAVNVGAGTITCNYDGIEKHGTVIGDGAFIGSNSTLVAPLEIGAGSYLAAGSVITQPVPADALGIGRAQQVIKEEWAKKRRARNQRGQGSGIRGAKQ
jgi:bifunctional UDP-N-acetylglucosamine pyrophosphorylase / glucosamine-1-phosphate N-acetyltransferase